MTKRPKRPVHREHERTTYSLRLCAVTIEHCRCYAWRARVRYGMVGATELVTDWSRPCTGCHDDVEHDA